jgi:hypothetical protein
MTQPKRQRQREDDNREFASFVHAALVCGCPNCRHAARVRSRRYQADITFRRAFNVLTSHPDRDWSAPDRSRSEER